MIPNEKISMELGPTDTSMQVPSPVFTTFSVEGKEILRIDNSGMVYKGKRIEDAGEAHSAFIEAMGRLGVLP